MIESVSGYMADVLSEGNVALIVAIPPHREMLTKRLAERGLDMTAIMAEGRYVLVDAEEALSSFLLEGWPDPARYKQMMANYLTQLRSAARGNPPEITILGEMVGLLWSRGQFDAAIRLEQLWNELQEKESFSLRCVYPMKGFERAEHAAGFFAICSEHSHVIPGEGYRELRELAARQLKAQDEDRRQIARNLLEGAGQDLTLLNISLSDLEDEARLLNPSLAKGVEAHRETLRRMSDDLREFTYSLHPPLLDEAGLEVALRWYVSKLRQQGKLHVALNVAPDFGRFRRDLEMALFRIVQEGLANVAAHSGATQAAVRMTSDADQIHLAITDEGKGIPADHLSAIAEPAESRMGLREIRERVMSFGGEMKIVSSSRGTEIRVTVRALR